MVQSLSIKKYQIRFCASSGVYSSSQNFSHDEPCFSDLQVVEISTYDDVVFESSVFGAISCNLYIPPNTIDFSRVFSQFNELLKDSPVVFAVVITVTVSFLCGLMVAFILDRKDTKLVSFLMILITRNVSAELFNRSLEYFFLRLS